MTDWKATTRTPIEKGADIPDSLDLHSGDKRKALTKAQVEATHKALPSLLSAFDVPVHVAASGGEDHLEIHIGVPE